MKNSKLMTEKFLVAAPSSIKNMKSVPARRVSRNLKGQVRNVEELSTSDSAKYLESLHKFDVDTTKR